MTDILGYIDTHIGAPNMEFVGGEDLFNKMADFIIDLQPDNLSNDQLEEVMSIIDLLEIDTGEDIDDVKEEVTYKKAPKASLDKKRHGKKYYRNNSAKIKSKKSLFKRSADGRKTQKLKKVMKKTGRTATGRDKVQYNILGAKKK